VTALVIASGADQPFGACVSRGRISGEGAIPMMPVAAAEESRRDAETAA
jgi:hypothetical protein